eukprot:5775639-Lingulodinium_polyedra.AAC.1
MAAASEVMSASANFMAVLFSVFMWWRMQFGPACVGLSVEALHGDKERSKQARNQSIRQHALEPCIVHIDK